MIYARVHDRTVAEDYYAAMAVIEKRLEPHLPPVPELAQNGNGRYENGESNQPLLALVDDLADGALDEHQCQLVAELRQGILALTR